MVSVIFSLPLAAVRTSRTSTSAALAPQLHGSAGSRQLGRREDARAGDARL